MPPYSLDTFDPNISAGYLIRRVFKLYQSEIESRFADLDISFTQWSALILVAKGLAQTPSDVAQLIGNDSGSTTRLIDGLEQRGFISRTRCTDDRRVVRLALTDKGMAATLSLVPRVMDYWNDLLSDFTPEESQQLVVLLQRVKIRLEDHVSHTADRSV